MLGINTTRAAVHALLEPVGITAEKFFAAEDAWLQRGKESCAVVGPALKAAAVLANIKVSQLCETTGKSKTYWHDILQGRSLPTRSEFIAAVKLLTGDQEDAK